jgi:hypothetical protein
MKMELQEKLTILENLQGKLNLGALTVNAPNTTNEDLVSLLGSVHARVCTGNDWPAEVGNTISLVEMLCDDC